MPLVSQPREGRVSLLLATAGFAGLAWISSTLAWPVQSLPTASLPPLPEETRAIGEWISRLQPLKRPRAPVQPGDWLESHFETGQTFRQYLADRPRPVPAPHRKLVILPLGEGSPPQQAIIRQTARFLAAFFGVTVQIADPVLLDDVPAESQRPGSAAGSRQLRTDWLLNDILLPRRPDDVLAFLGLTIDDLWPGPGGNFVYGQASLTERVGVWSLARNGDPSESPDAYRLCLRRTVKTAVHETGHMLGIPHCIAAECGMNGSNHREESDRQPIEFCPECQAKVWWSCGVPPEARCRTLHQLAAEAGLEREAALWRAEAEQLVQETPRTRRDADGWDRKSRPASHSRPSSR